MASIAVNNYITAHYERWRDYAFYHCGLCGIEDEADDVLNEVLCSLLGKDGILLGRLLGAKKNGYTELDFFVLRMIKLSVTSPTSGYQRKYKSLPVDRDVDYSRIDFIEAEEDMRDTAGDTLEKMRRVRDIFESLDLPPFCRRVFHFRFFEGKDFSEWEGSETLRSLYRAYNKARDLIKEKLNENLYFRKKDEDDGQTRGVL